jgi:ankyrin repeat protein
MEKNNKITRQGVDINCVNQEGLTPLLQLIKNGHSRKDLMDVIQILLNQEGIDVN